MIGAKDPAKGLTQRYIAAMLLVAGLATGAMLLLQLNLARQTRMIEAIEATEQQRRVIKDVAMGASALIEARSPLELQTAVLRIDNNLDLLTRGLMPAIERALKPSILVRRQGGTGGEHIMVETHLPRLIKAARALTYEPPVALNRDNPLLFDIAQNTGPLLAMLDDVTAMQVSRHDRETRNSRKAALAVWSGTLLILYLIAVQLFRPMAAHISRTINALRRAMIRLRREQEALDVANTLLKAELDAAPHGVVAFDHNGLLLSHNQRFATQWALEPHELLDKASGDLLFRRIQAQCQDPSSVHEVTETILANENIVYTDILTLIDGRVFERSTRPLFTAEGKLMARIWFFRDQTEQQALHEDQLHVDDAMERNAAELARLADDLYLANEAAEQANRTLEEQRTELERLANTDMLTDLPNRRAFFDHGHRWLKEVGDGVNLSVIMLDVDHFKRLNDEWGHDAGDRALAELGYILGNYQDDKHCPGRLGGEEFALLLRDHDLTLAIAVAEKLRQQIAQIRLSVGDATLNFTASLGIATAQASDEDFDILLKRADGALYNAKNSGRNRISTAEDGESDAGQSGIRRESRPLTAKPTTEIEADRPPMTKKAGS